MRRGSRPAVRARAVIDTRPLAPRRSPLRGAAAVLTREVLKHAKRFHATVSFDADTGLRECKELGATVPPLAPLRPRR